MFWLVAAGMTGLAALAVLWPLSLRRVRPTGAEGETAFYRAQLREIERDVERGQLPAEEAASARAEAARRLIAASAGTAAADAPAPGALGRRRLASLIILVFVPALALGVYAYVGHPDEPDEPLAARMANPNSNEAIDLAIAKIEARLATHPDDGRGWEVLAPVYMKLGRFDDAVAAYRQALRLTPPTAAKQAAYGEALLAAAQGTVTAPAREAFEKALTIDPQDAMARFYLGLAAEQDGDTAKAKAVYEALEPQAKGDAPWMIGLNARLQALRGGAPAAGPAASNAASTFSPEQQKMIQGMVSGLAQRLAENGGSADEWARLIRAYTVLKETDKAKSALADARKAYQSDKTALGNFDALARELGIGG